ncbi:MAG: LacI family DNA-binding transcriptional regulator [Anaerovibrio sp.]|uniref:LacI family DNA-binding transcriptional regulator n=1 Tax=Anaerovibrio sp. TaxID=1872532 RepID=UPI00260087E7|nr:LacI family DNA-binding transcriptional regulator [Anaerovibrio sp.]MCR5175592.1 LacI family DNA-binding transcriptional regulator [Anaerovibrio sp.]
MKVNIKKISELSGFSVATVSNALSNKRGVNKDTAERIIKIARECGYVKEDRIKRIKMVTYRDSGAVFNESPFFSTLLDSIEAESRHSGYDVSIVNLYRHHSDYEDNVRTLLNDTMSAVLLVGTEMNEADASRFADASVPLVMVDNYFESLYFDTVLMDNEDSVVKAMNYLIENGHKKIGYLRGDTRIRNFISRGRGYKRALWENDLPVSDDLTYTVKPSVVGAFEGVNRFITEGRKMPTAFFADNDMIALGAMQALQKNGFSIPGDISIIGFDDINLGEAFAPGLTTIRVDIKAMGRLAVRRLIAQIQNREEVHSCTRLYNSLVIRGSVGTRNDG